MSRLFSGQPPRGGTALGKAGDFILWMRATHSHPWVRLKLVADDGIRLPKANFHLAWSVTEKRLALTKDTKRLQEDNPAMVRQVETACRTQITPDSIPKRAKPATNLDELRRLRNDMLRILMRLDDMIEGAA